MPRFRLKREKLFALGFLPAIVGVLLAGFALRETAGDSKASGPATSAVSNEKYLYVWTGDQARKNADFLAVVNFDETSPNYGKVITTVPLPAPGNTWNEPHHVGLSRDGKVLAAGGLLSVLKGQKEIFFFDVSNPESPKFISAADPPQ